MFRKNFQLITIINCLDSYISLPTVAGKRLCFECVSSSASTTIQWFQNSSTFHAKWASLRRPLLGETLHYCSLRNKKVRKNHWTYELDLHRHPPLILPSTPYKNVPLADVLLPHSSIKLTTIRMCTYKNIMFSPMDLFPPQQTSVVSLSPMLFNCSANWSRTRWSK